MAYRKGITLQLGMIATQVDLESAAETEQSLKTVCVGTTTPHPPTAIKQSPTCPDCGNKDYPTFKRARVENKTDFVVVDTDEVAATRDASIGVTKSIIQLSVHPTAQVRSQTIQGKSSSYYLTPSKPALAVLYGLVVDALRRWPDVSLLGVWTPVGRPGLYQVSLYQDTTLMLSPLEWAEAVKVTAQPDVPIPAENQKQIDALVSSLVTDFEADTYANTFKANLEALLASKTAEEGVVGESTPRSTPTTSGGGVDLTAMLSMALGDQAA